VGETLNFRTNPCTVFQLRLVLGTPKSRSAKALASPAGPRLSKQGSEIFFENAVSLSPVNRAQKGDVSIEAFAHIGQPIQSQDGRR
jgi:hypothetical protein